MLRNLFVVLILLWTVNSSARYIINHGGSSADVRQIIKNKPNINRDLAHRIATASKMAAVKYKIPTRFILAIAFIESSYNPRAYNRVTKDYGLMQISKWHVERSNLSKVKLLVDLKYNVEHGARIFSWFYHRYPLNEAVARYNCGTRRSCIHNRKVKKYVKRFIRAL